MFREITGIPLSKSLIAKFSLWLLFQGCKTSAYAASKSYRNAGKLTHPPLLKKGAASRCVRKMKDSIDSLAADILASECVSARHFADRAEALWRDGQNEIRGLRTELEKAKTRSKMKDRKISELERQIANLKKIVFGAKADRNPNKDQLQKGDGPSDQSVRGHTANSATPNSGNDLHGHRQTPRRLAQRNRNGRGKREFTKYLERFEIYMGTTDKKCPCGCGGSIRGYDINETLEMVPARYYVAVRKYPKYRCRAADKVVGTPFIPRIFPQTTMSNGFLANVIFMRFGAQLPWYRQEGLLKASGIDLNRSTLMTWSNRIAIQALQPVYELLLRELLHNSARLFMGVVAESRPEL